jgi:mono/diheme cytochrome c family protein
MEREDFLMKKTVVLFLAAGLLVTGFWGAGTGKCADERGKTIFDGKCAMCHGTDGSGNGPAAAALNPGPADFNTASFWGKMSDARITEVIENGHGSMPAFTLSSGEIRAVINYMKEAFKP